LALVSGLVFGDYMLWNWSLGGNHTVVALVSGLTLPPLAVAFLWLLALNLARLLASATMRSARSRAGEPTAEMSRKLDDEQAAASSSSKLAA